MLPAIQSAINNRQSAIGNRYTFQGREIDWTTGLIYFRARWYNPDTGRWLSKDPIGISGGLNLYAFCGNNPVNFVDPYGEVAGVIAAIIVFTPVDDIIVGAIVAAAGGYMAAELRNESRRGGNERGITGKAEGTKNEWKHRKPHPTDPKKMLQKDPQTGKWKIKPLLPGAPWIAGAQEQDKEE